MLECLEVVEPLCDWLGTGQQATCRWCVESDKYASVPRIGSGVQRLLQKPHSLGMISATHRVQRGRQGRGVWNKLLDLGGPCLKAPVSVAARLRPAKWPGLASVFPAW